MTVPQIMTKSTGAMNLDKFTATGRQRIGNRTNYRQLWQSIAARLQKRRGNPETGRGYHPRIEMTSQWKRESKSAEKLLTVAGFHSIPELAVN